MFDDIDNLDEIEVSETGFGDTGSIDNSTFVEASSSTENYALNESSCDLLNLAFDSINSAESFLQHYSGSLTIEEVNDAVQDASNFFNMESPLIVSEGWTTGVFNKDLTIASDDVLIFNSDQLESLGITEKDGLDLVMTHENAHRALQGLETGFSEHQEELCCDYMAGVRAGLNSIGIERMSNSFADMPETITHPAGNLRNEALKEGQEYASTFLAENGHAPTFEDCIERFRTSNAYLQTSDPLALMTNEDCTNENFHSYSQADVEWYEHQARISSGSEQEHWLKEAKWAKEHINSFAPQEIGSNEALHAFYGGQYGNATGDYIDDSYLTHDPYEDFHGLFVDDRAYHLREAQTAKENAEWHHKRANDAIEKGDLSSARDHNSSAALYEKSYKDHISASKKCTK